MNLNDLTTLFRQETDDTELPYLWSDEEVTEYANDAIIEASRRARLLVDSRTPAVCEAAVIALDPWVVLDPRVLFIRRAIIAGSSQVLQKIQQRELDACVPGWEDSIATTSTHFIQGAAPGQIRLWPPPAVAGTIRMTVVRDPLGELSNPDDEPEIAPRYHRSLVRWMVYRAFTKPDSDTADKERALIAMQQFEAEFGKRSSAQEEQWAQEHYGIDPFDGQY